MGKTKLANENGDEELAPAVEKLVGVVRTNTGGGVMCWVFEDGTRELYLGYGNGNLGASYTADPAEYNYETDELKTGATAQEQAGFIFGQAQKHGFTL